MTPDSAPHDAALARAPESIGRFQVIGRLGQGAQSFVYLAYDPQLQREVALKAVRLEPNDARRAALLREARAVSRLAHPAIVPVFEALDSAQGPCLVFEYVAGQTLAERIEAEGAIAPAQAVALLLPVLDAVAYAHAQRIVHRDLKPSNILLDDLGRARVMDFGIAVRHDAPADDGSDGYTAMLGTPAYMAPEYAGEGQVAPLMDVFAAGLVLYEMLCGQRAVGARQGVAAIRYLLKHDVLLPDDLAVPLDEDLRCIVHKALERDPQARHLGMAELADALRRWLSPSLYAPLAAAEMARAAKLDALLARLPQDLVFPSPPAALAAARKVLDAAGAADAVESAVMEALTPIVLNDASLTLLLLRLANGPQARAFGAAPVSSVSKALAQLGLADAAQALRGQRVLGDDPQNAADRLLALLYTYAQRVGRLAQALSGLAGPDGEEARIVGMLASLGAMALAAGLPQEAKTVLGASPPGQRAQATRAQRLLGVGLDELGGALAQAWGLPAVLLQGMAPARPGDLPAMPATRVELLRTVSALAAELIDASTLGDNTQRQAATRAAVQRYAACLCLSAHEARKAMERADARAASGRQDVIRKPRKL